MPDNIIFAGHNCTDSTIAAAGQDMAAVEEAAAVHTDPGEVAGTAAAVVVVAGMAVVDIAAGHTAAVGVEVAVGSTDSESAAMVAVVDRRNTAVVVVAAAAADHIAAVAGTSNTIVILREAVEVGEVMSPGDPEPELVLMAMHQEQTVMISRGY